MRQYTLRVDGRDRMKCQRIGEFNIGSRRHSDISCQHQQRTLCAVARLHQRLPFIRQLHLGAQHIDTCCHPCIALFGSKLIQCLRRVHPRLRRHHLGKLGLRREIQGRNIADHQIPRILIVFLGRRRRVPCRAQAVPQLHVHNRLVRIGSGVIDAEGPDDLRQRHPRETDALRRKTLALDRNRRGNPHPREQQRLTSLGCTHRFLRARLRQQHSQIRLQPAMNCILQREPVGRGRAVLRARRRPAS